MKFVRTLNNARLAFFSIAYGLSGALIGGTLNRIMIAELGLPATLVPFFFAIPLLISPVRVWLTCTQSIPLRRRPGFGIDDGLNGDVRPARGGP